MRLSIISFILALVMASSILSQDLTNEEKAVKQAVFNVAQAYMNRDYDEWQKLVYQDESYYNLGANINYYSEFNGWEAINSDPDTKAWFDLGVRDFGELPIKNLNIKVTKEMAFVSFDWNLQKGAKVMIKEDGLWKELCNVAVLTWGYERVKNFNYLQKFDGDWQVDVASLVHEGTHPSPDITSAKMTISTSMDQIEYIMHSNHKGSGQGWTATHNWQYAVHNDNSIHVMSHVITSNYQTWVHLGTAELSNDLLTAKVNRKNDPDDELLVRTLEFKDVNTINETQEWYVGDKKVNSVFYTWKR